MSPNGTSSVIFCIYFNFHVFYNYITICVYSVSTYTYIYLYIYIYLSVHDSYDCTLRSYSCRLKNIWWFRDPAPPHKAHLHKAARKWPRCFFPERMYEYWGQVIVTYRPIVGSTCFQGWTTTSNSAWTCPASSQHPATLFQRQQSTPVHFASQPACAAMRVKMRKARYDNNLRWCLKWCLAHCQDVRVAWTGGLVWSQKRSNSAWCVVNFTCVVHGENNPVSRLCLTALRPLLTWCPRKAKIMGEGLSKR